MKKILYLFCLLYAAQLSAQERKLPPQMLSSAVLIVLDDGTMGSGFFMADSGKVFFVTARHVLGDVDSAGVLRVANSAELSFFPNDPSVDKLASMTLNLHGFSEDKRIRFGRFRNVAIIYIGDITSNDKGLAVIKYSRNVVNNRSTVIPLLSAQSDARSYERVNLGGTVYLYGYPSSLGISNHMQFDYQRPLLRWGVVSAKYEPKRTIVIDCALYQGNSGGPVWEKVEDEKGTHFYLIGLAIEYVPYVQEYRNVREGVTNHEVTNSGYSIITSVDSPIELMKTFR